MFVYISVALDESANATGTVQLLIQWKLSAVNPVLNRKLPIAEICFGPMNLAQTSV
jgi:hypothetical protein